MSTTASDRAQTVQEQTLKVVRQSQQAVVDAVRTWAKAVESAIPELPAVPYGDRIPTPTEVVERSFSFAEELLKAQHEFAQNLLSAASPVLEKTDQKPTSTEAA